MDAHSKALKRTWAVTAAALLLSAAWMLTTAGARRVAADAPAPAPSRIVSVVPAVTEMLFAMGAGPAVVGVSSYDKVPAETAALPKVGALIDPDFERILSLRPDLVIVYGTQTDFIARLQRASIPMFRYEHAGLPDITQTIRRLGARVGHDAEAERLAASIEHDLDSIRRRVAGQPAVRTLLIFGREPGSLRGIYASGGVGFLHDLLVLAGGVDAFDDVRRQSVQISTEQVLARAPDAVIELHEAALSAASLAESRALWRQLGAVPAVRNDRVYFLTGDFLTVPGPRIAMAAKAMADVLHLASTR
jgi:iron complex transport system substrate-binding protein